MRHHTARPHDAVASDVYPWGQHTVGPYPHIVFNDHLGRGDGLFVKPLLWVTETMVQSRYHNPLGKIHMVPDSYGANNGIVQPHTTVVPDAYGSHGIVHASIALYHTLLAQREGLKGHHIHAGTMMDHAAPGTSRVEGTEQAKPQSGTCFHGMNHQPKKQFLQFSMFQFCGYLHDIYVYYRCC